MKEKVVVIIVNYKNSEDTATCVKSLLKQKYEHLSVLVVDNSEEDKYTKELQNLLEKEKPFIIDEKEKEYLKLNFSKDVFVIKANENNGFSAGNNVGIFVAIKNRADYIWILNNDTVVENETIEEMLKTAKSYDVPVVTCKIKDYREKDKVQYNGRKVYLKPIEDHVDILKIPTFLSGANIFVKRSVFEEIGFLDEDFFLYFEDNEFHYRLQKSGIKTLYTPFTYIYHKGGASIGGYLNNPLSMYYFVRNLLIYVRKTGRTNFSETFEEIEKQYLFNYKDKTLLKAIILGIYDFVKGKKGKREDLFVILNSKDKYEKPKGKLENLSLEKLFKLSFSYPRKKEYFFEIINRLKTGQSNSLENSSKYKSL